MFADWIDYMFTGSTDRKASKGMQEAWPKIKEGVAGLPGAIAKEFKRHSKKKVQKK